MTYWDASAFVPLVRNEATSAALRSLYGGRDAHFTLTTTRVEIECAFARLLHRGEIDAARAGVLRAGAMAILGRFTLVPPDASIIDGAVRLARIHPTELRAGDALHLAAWQAISEEDPGAVEFFCNDQRLRSAALAEGATVLP